VLRLRQQFANATLAHAARLCGTVMRGHPQYKSLPLRKDFVPLSEELPANFDAREHWTQCKVRQLIQMEC
jgi:hypothetical protein